MKQAISHCGFVTKKLLHIRSWKCSECGTAHDRDINAATDILIFGRAVWPDSALQHKKPVESLLAAKRDVTPGQRVKLR
jgi:transposase